MYDYIIVGSGLFGSTFANLVHSCGKSCLVLEKRNHIGGNIYTEKKDGINIHMYGPHIFHTSNEKIWKYINKFSKFNNFLNRPKVKYKNNIYSFPINLLTLYQLWGVITPEQAKNKLNSVKLKIKNPSNLEEWILNQVGEEIYETFIYGYTKKQWGKEPCELPSSIVKRLPIRLDFNDGYYNNEDIYQGIPIDGYTVIINNMLKDIQVELNEDFNKNKAYWLPKAKHIVYTGAIDQLFDYKLGVLEYRSLKFVHEKLKIGDFQGNAIVNYTEYQVPYTRIIEHKHFENVNVEHTIITKEFPEKWTIGKESYYPLNNSQNDELYKKYIELAKKEYPNFIFGGRLASYKYFDMHQVIGQAMHKAQEQFC
jgi:UDP-galactopyranose mutase